MAKEEEKKAKKAADPKAPGEGIPPREFEDIELPTELPPSEPGGEFEEIEMEMAPGEEKYSPEALLAAKAQLEKRLILDVTEQAFAAESGTESHGFENIVGVGLGEKMVGGGFTGERCVSVYVAAKVPAETLASAAVVPKEVNGIPTDVIETGEFHAFPNRGKYRPAPGGVSVGHYKITAGTLGCLVRRGPALYILSNNHVLANCNNARIGDPILQPGPYDGGRVPADVIAKLSQFVPLRFGGPVNHVDCAIAQTSPRLVTPLNKCYGKIVLPIVLPALNMTVKKCGRTTQFTQGRITGTHATVTVGYGTSGSAVFQNQIIMVSLSSTPFSAGGDSGSLIVTLRGNRPVGLLFAGSATTTIANPIGEVLRALNVTIYP